MNGLGLAANPDLLRHLKNIRRAMSDRSLDEHET